MWPELIQENYLRAAVHLRSGFRIFEDWRTRNSCSTVINTSVPSLGLPSMEKDPAQMITRLGSHTLLLNIKPTSFPSTSSCKNVKPNLTPYTRQMFSGLSEVRCHLESLYYLRLREFQVMEIHESDSSSDIYNTFTNKINCSSGTISFDL